MLGSWIKDQSDRSPAIQEPRERDNTYSNEVEISEDHGWTFQGRVWRELGRALWKSIWTGSWKPGRIWINRWEEAQVKQRKKYKPGSRETVAIMMMIATIIKTVSKFWELALCESFLPSATSMFSCPGLPRIGGTVQTSWLALFCPQLPDTQATVLE